MKKKLIIVGITLFSIVSLIGCGKTMEDFEKEQYSLQESISKVEENSSIEETIQLEEITNLGDNKEVVELTPFDIVLSKYDFEPLVKENTIDLGKLEPASIDLFYDAKEGYSCRHNGILYMIPYLNETFGYDILDGAKILKRSEIKETFGISNEYYEDACVFIGNNRSQNDIFAIFKIREMEGVEIQSILDYFDTKLNTFISNKLISETDQRIYSRIAAIPTVNISQKYIFIVSLGENENKLNEEDVFEYFSGTGDVATLRIADVITLVTNGMIVDNYFESDIFGDFNLNGMTWEEYEEHKNELITFENEKFQNDEKVILEKMEVNESFDSDSGVY